MLQQVQLYDLSVAIIGLTAIRPVRFTKQDKGVHKKEIGRGAGREKV